MHIHAVNLDADGEDTSTSFGASKDDVIYQVNVELKEDKWELCMLKMVNRVGHH